MNANNATLELTEPGTDLMPTKEMTLKTSESTKLSKLAVSGNAVAKLLLLPVGICAGVFLIKIVIVASEIIASLNALYVGMPN